VLGDRVAEVRQRVGLAVVFGGEGGAGRSEQVGEVPSCAGQQVGEPLDLGEHDRNVGDGGPDADWGEPLMGGVQVGDDGLPVDGRARDVGLVRHGRG
jgi:hypothetical protein